MANNHLWYKNAVIYQIHVKCFHDSNEDGIGDFQGLTEKLDYIQSLGCTAIWLQPFYPSPLLDDGYDIADYCNIHPDYGTLKDFRHFLQEAHRRKLKVVTELVINHTSEKHKWFQRARHAKPRSRWRDYYVWSNTPEKYSDARVIFKDYETSNWQWDPVAQAYYWHRFYSHQPDLNYDNPHVHQEIFKLVDFWMGMGVDGMRLDAIPYLYQKEGTDCENLPGTHEFLKKLRKYIDEKYSDRMLLAEANQWPDQASAYFGDGDECHMAFHFPAMPRLFMAIRIEDRFPIIDIMEQTPTPPESCQWATFLRNHDELTLEMVTDEERDFMYRAYAKDPKARINLGIRRRLAPLLDNDRAKIELMNILLFSFPGSPIIYYGDEIGMGDNYYLGDRNGVRTPMQWNTNKNAGFSRANPQKLYLPLIIDPQYHHAYLNVENQEQSVTSLLLWMRKVISVRHEYHAFGYGSLTFLLPENAKILAFIREHKEETILVVINLSRYSQYVELNLSFYAGYTPMDLFSHNYFSVIKEEPYGMTLGGYGYFWLTLEKEPEPFIAEEISLPEQIQIDQWKELVIGNAKHVFFKKLLPPYLKQSRWFRAKTQKIRHIYLIDSFTFGSALLLMIQVVYSNADPEIYFLPVTCVSADIASTIMEKFPQAIISRFEEGSLIDAIYDETFRTTLLEMIIKRKKFKTEISKLTATSGSRAQKLLHNKPLPLSSRVIATEQTNSSIIYEDLFFLKIYRRLDEGINPEVDLVRHLTEKAHFPNVPAYAGTINWERGKESVSMAIVQEFIPNGGDAWTYILDVVKRYLEDGLTKISKAELDAIALETKEIPESIREPLGWMFVEMISLLGQRTAEMHQALAHPSKSHNLGSEPFTFFYQKSLYQYFRAQVRKIFNVLQENLKILSEETKALAEKVLAQENALIKHFKNLLNEKISVVKIPIHGDYHLGQVLYTGTDLIIIDFEGEPAIPLSERRLKRCALQDVAGMLRSFNYVAAKALEQFKQLHKENSKALEILADFWYQYASNVFLKSYKQTLLQCDVPIIPKNEEHFNTLLQAYLMNKAVYELGYELQNRPEWIHIPLKGILQS